MYITKEVFDEFRKTKFSSKSEAAEAGTNLIEFLSKGAGTQLVKNEGFLESASEGWAGIGRGFTRAMDIRKELTPGYYVATLTMRGPMLVPFQVTNDDILDLPGEKTEDIIKRADEFWDLEDSFKALNFIHKRGILIKGQPGCGKSIVAFKVGRNLIQKRAGIVIYPTSPYSMEDCARDIREVEPNKKILNVIEDIDMMVGMYGERTLTAFLDGETSIDKILTLGITNDDRILSSRLTARPSRFDVIETVGVLTAEARKSFLEQKATSLTPEQIDLWVSKTEDYTVPMLKELMIMVLAYCCPLDSSVEKINKTFKSRIADV